MKVFVTGATGFVGSHVLDRLVEAGHRPRCLVRTTSDTTHLDGLGVATVVGSLGEVDAMQASLEWAEAVIHIAGVVKARDFDEFYRFNGRATGQLARLAGQVNPELDRFVYVSSVSAQGPSKGAHPPPAGAQPAPVSHYGKSKLAGEQAVQTLADTLPVSIFRPPPVYGPRDHEMLAAFQAANYRLAPVYGDGRGHLSVVHVYDLADAIVASIDTDHPSGAVFPIDDGGVHTWNSLTAEFGRAVGKKAYHIHVPGPLFKAAGYVSESVGRVFGRAVIFNTDKVAEMSQDSWICGHQRLGELLGWAPQWPLERGARQTAAWYEDHGWL